MGLIQLHTHKLTYTRKHSVTKLRCKSIVGYLQSSIAATGSSGFVQLVKIAQQALLIVANQIA